MLQEVEWGEFRIGDLFEIKSYAKRFDANKVTLLEKGKYPYVVRMSSNNGQKGYIDEDEKYLNSGNTISFGQDTATMFYQEIPYFTGDKIKILKSKYERFGKKNAQFFIAALTKSFSNFSWGSSSFCVPIIEKQIVMLPKKDDAPDFNFMDSFIAKLETERLAELEAERMVELEAYLSVTGLNNYNLTEGEQNALEDYDKLNWVKVPYRSIFNRIEQGRRLKKEDQIFGNIPFVMSGTTNTGVVNFISNPVASFPKNSITVDIFGNVFYRNYDFGAGDDTGVYWNDAKKYSKKQMIFFAASMKRSLLNKFSYGKKLRSSESYDIQMMLPIKDEKIDYDYMNMLVSAIQKLIIKDVVSYADREIEATKEVINKG